MDKKKNIMGSRFIYSAVLAVFLIFIIVWMTFTTEDRIKFLDIILLLLIISLIIYPMWT